MSKKSPKIAALIEKHQGRTLSAYYLGYFELFNARAYYESHDVLEELWLPIRRTHAGDFYKGLIQLAGAFVHLRKDRLKPAAALFKLAQGNLRKFSPRYEQLDLLPLLQLIDDWLASLEVGDFQKNPWSDETAPTLLGPDLPPAG